MRLTIGMPSYNNFTEVFFTVQALRMYQDLTDCEILVVDNFGGDPELEKFIKNQGGGLVRYEKYLESNGPAGAKDAVVRLARGEMVMCIDSHVLLIPGALKHITVTDDFVQGPLMYCDIKNFVCEWKPVWRGHMWGVWGDYSPNLPKDPFEIWGCGGGLFVVRKSSWLGFNPKFRGFGGEEGYIHEKYRKAGRKVICNPHLVWMHMFDRKIPYPLKLIDRVRNYLIGFEEIGMDTKAMEEHFGPALINEARAIIAQEKALEVKVPEIIKSSVPTKKCLLTICDGANMSDELLENKKEYAKKYNWDFICKMDGIDRSRSTPFSKVKFILECLEKYDLVFWNDMASVFTNFTQDVTEVLKQDEYIGALEEKYNYLCCDNMLIKGNDYTKDFFRSLSKLESWKNDSHPWDQRCFNEKMGALGYKHLKKFNVGDLGAFYKEGWWCTRPWEPGDFIVQLGCHGSGGILTWQERLDIFKNIYLGQIQR